MDAVVKVGGSLERHKNRLTTLVHTLTRLAEKHRIIAVPGGGSFADRVREVTSTYSIDDQTAHKMAILAMDQYGLMLSAIARSALTSYSIDEVQALSEGRLCIYLPSRELLTDSALRACWDVTSDSIAAYVAGRCGYQTLILLKDVDGIYTKDPKEDREASLLKTVDLKSLAHYACVDKVLPHYLKAFKLRCWILNGLKSRRIERLFTKGWTQGTMIAP